MFKCNHCNSIFDEPDIDRVNAEDYYGVSSIFVNCNYIDIEICPYCGCEEIEAYWEDDDEDI